ncbi:MAG: hypothetical protein KJ623_04815 [Nanoarchaeota archaeon]|nr:hypothetical protein [Nanoarchaeota archaeon]MBU0962681.1 hypothetical protein [Nanoarchaeota archaeon]
MKRGILLLIILLLVPFVSATIYTDSQFNSKYNLGDYVLLSGNLIESQDTQGLLNILLSCGNETQQLAVKSINIKTEESASFSYKLPITGNLIGDCKFLIVLKDINNNLIEQSETSSFEITKELTGNFDISSNEFQLGDKLTINGNIKNLNSKNINGAAIIYIKKDGINYVVDTVDIQGGSFIYNTKLSSIPAGSYTIDINVIDSNGNTNLFENSLSFDLYDELIISAKLDKDSYKPGDVLTLTGNVHKKTGPNVPNTKIEIQFENEIYNNDVKEGQYSFTSVLSKTIKSYYHNITLIVSDSDGNKGTNEINFEIIPIPTKLEAVFDKEGYIPEDNINIKINLYDQANDILSRNAHVKITDVDNKVVYEQDKLTTESVDYQLPQFAIPGDWKLDVESEGLKASTKISVESIEILSVNVVGQSLVIKNMGNDLFNDKVDIDSDGIIKSESVRLKPGEETSIELYKLFDDGTHTINVLGKSFVVSIVDPRNIVDKGIDGLGSITGYYAVKKYGTPVGIGYLILITAVLIVILTIITQIAFKFNMKKKPDHVKRKFDNFMDSKVKMPVKQEKKYDFKFGRADEHDLKDFRKRMMDKIDAERRNSFKLPDEKKDGKNNGGPFSMFG